MSAVTRPTRARGIRSNSTAPRTGFRKPDAQPPTRHMARITQSGTPSANSTNRGRPVIRNATTYVWKRGSRGAVRRRHERSRPSTAPPQTAKTRPSAATPGAGVVGPDRQQHRGPREVEQVGDRDHQAQAHQHGVVAQEVPAVAQLGRRTTWRWRRPSAARARLRASRLAGRSRLRGRSARQHQHDRADRRSETASIATALAAPTVATRPPAMAAPTIVDAALDRRREPGHPLVRDVRPLDQGRDHRRRRRRRPVRAGRRRARRAASSTGNVSRVGVVQQGDQCRPRPSRAGRR